MRLDLDVIEIRNIISCLCKLSRLNTDEARDVPRQALEELVLEKCVQSIVMVFCQLAGLDTDEEV